MSQDLPIPRQETRSDGTSVVEWGAAEPAPPGRVGRSLSGFGRDRRLPPVLAGLGVVAALASLFGEWYVMTVPNGGGPEGETTLRIPGGPAEVGAFGTGYLLGLLGLACLTALVLRGTPAVRQNARVTGLALAVGLPVLLAATMSSLGKSGERTFYYAGSEGFQVQYGRGLAAAFVACLLFGVALQVAGRYDAERPDEPADKPGDEPAEGAPQVWPRWRGRTGRDDRDDDRPPAPADLTVQPTVPFARPEPPV